MTESTLNKIHYSIAREDEFYEIKHFLKRNQTYPANRSDVIYLVRSGQSLIGLARLLKIEDSSQALWLRGLFISEQWRGKKIATQLLSKIYESQLSNRNIKTIYAFAEQHLSDFYALNQYDLIAPETLPTSLKQKSINAKKQGKKWLCLSRTIQ